MKLPVEFVNRVHRALELDTGSKFSSFAQNFFSSTEMSEVGLSESEIKKDRVTTQLLKLIPGPGLTSVLSSWGEGAKNKLQNILKEYEENKADIGRCKKPKQRIEVKPEAVPQREDTRRFSPDKASKANQELQNLYLLLAMGRRHSQGKEEGMRTSLLL